MRNIYALVVVFLVLCGVCFPEKMVQVLFMVSQEQLLIDQLNGQGIPNPAAALITRNYSERRIIEAAQALAKRGGRSEKVVTALIEALNKYHNVDSGDGLILVRSEIALALGRIGDPAAIKPLIAILASDDPLTHSPAAMFPPEYKFVERTSHGAVAEALGMFGEQAKEAVPYIVPILRYSGFRFEADPGRAVQALGQIKAPESIPALVEVLSNPDCRAVAAEALGNFGSQAKEALPVLQAVAQQSDIKIYEQIVFAEAIRKIKINAVVSMEEDNGAKVIETQRYTLYIPAGVQGGKRYPLVFTIYPSPDPQPMLEAWRATADKYTLIILSSKEHSNGMKFNKIGQMLTATLRDVIEVYPVDPSMVIASGFSGGGMSAHYLAMAYPDLVRGVVVNTAMISENFNPGKVSSYPRNKSAVFLASPSDFRYEEMKMDRDFLKGLGWNIQWIEFDGGHTIAPPTAYEQAAGWFLKK